MDSQVEVLFGHAIDVGGHTGVLGTVTELSHVDLQVAAIGQNMHTGRGLQKDFKRDICEHVLGGVIALCKYVFV